MKTIEISDAKEPLSAYARRARKEPVLVTKNGRPYVTLTAVRPDTDLENLIVTTHPTFRAILARSEARYRTEGGLTTEEVRRQLGLKPRAARRKRR